MTVVGSELVDVFQVSVSGILSDEHLGDEDSLGEKVDEVEVWNWDSKEVGNLVAEIFDFG